MRILLLLFVFSGMTLVAKAQKKFEKAPAQRSNIVINKLSISDADLQQLNEQYKRGRDLSTFSMKKKGTLRLSNTDERIVYSPKTGLPIYWQSQFDFPLSVQTRGSNIENQAFSFLAQQQTFLKIANSSEEFVVVGQKEDKLGKTHLTLEQRFAGLPVYGAEIKIHLDGDQVELMNGQYFATPQLQSLQAQLSTNAVEKIALEDLSKITNIVEIKDDLLEITGEEQISQNQLVIYFTDEKGTQARLAYHLKVAANPLHKWTYLIDAENGEILRKFNRVCSLHNHDDGHHHINWSAFKMPKPINASMLDGQATATAMDLNGAMRTINTYELGGTYYLLDGSRDMWKGFTPDGSDFNGGIYTASGGGTNLENFEPVDLTSSNNAWTDREAVSAHANAGIAYEYFRTTFGRNSINGSGGDIISFFNVADDDGGGMDNAFWSGAAMFYGSGRDAFRELAASLDVAGHEMSHGVIQNSANLEYQGESGALNESYADIFGVMIDRDDWQLGEEVVNRNAFPSGALRDMANPNNGGSRLGDRGYQPATVSEQFFGPEDNGGVHINSGIVNRAFYLFATSNGIGRDIAEQVYYHALDNYLTRSSQFIDARLAVIRSAQEEYGTAVANAAAAAFDAVGITDGTPTAPPQEAEVNLGNQFILAIGAPSFGSENGQGIYIRNIDGSALEGANPLINDEVLFKPSISDDGSRIVYINGNNQLRLINIDWTAGDVELQELDNTMIWRRAAISKDGLRLAATTTDLLPEIYVFDLITGQGNRYELSNPTTAEGGISSGEVQYADGLEWDLSSQFVIYDAFNQVSGLFDDYVYVDIGSFEGWNTQTGNFGDGQIEKLFATLPDDIFIGNPAISKNSPNILAFDLINTASNETAILGVDIETGATGTIEITSNLGFPNYSVDDQFIIFEDEDFFGDKEVRLVGINDDKISSSVGSQSLINGAIWPNWFGTASRDLATSTAQALNPDNIQIKTFPNPASQNIMVNSELKEAGRVVYQIFDMLGKEVYRQEVQSLAGSHTNILPIDHLSIGTYLLKINIGDNIVTKKIVKQ